MIRLIKNSTFFFLFSFIWAQFETPVTLSAIEKEPVRAGEVATIVVTAKMDSEWRIYALRDQGKGPVASKVTLSGEIVKEIGMVIEKDPVVKYDDAFETTTRTHHGGTSFEAPFIINDKTLAGEQDVKVSVLYQVCNATLCYPPNEEKLITSVNILEGAPRDGYSEMTPYIESVFDDTGNISLDAAILEGFFSFIILALSMGFLSLLTPCVFPMIPITVSFFIKRGEAKKGTPLSNALIYTLGIVATFSILGFILALTLGASGANQLAANPWVNLFIGGLFIYFALSLFGMYEIDLPDSIKQLSLRQEGREGFIGTIFMAVTFTLTSFTCTVQFVGLLLVAASQGQWFWPLVGMVVFSTAFASPFFFLALFPQYLANIPKSGGWLNSTKVVMGFLEMAAAFKFLSNTDLVWGWGFFSHNMVLATWAILMILCGIYLLGKIRFPHDSVIEVISAPRLMISAIFLTFGIYLSSGLFGQRLHGLIYSYLPPQLSSDINSSSSGGYSYQEGLTWYKDLDKALAVSKSNGQPIFVDFTGYTCTNCRWMEVNVFIKPEIKERFEKMTLVQLYTDGGPNHKQNQEYEIDRFGTAALPFYVILSPENEVISTFPGMTRKLDDFIDFLDSGLEG
ncbi:MAG: cytochrome c biogenesis protein CcdA [Candidatus Neomarinimicrobiota bacterium]|nr:cytochrome c biogenesis protein CcdA [Candidatus Neomarinimicrobiota bacterium]